MIRLEDLTAIGKIRRPHALKGELNATLGIDREYLSEGDHVIIEMEGIPTPFFVEAIRRKGSDGILIKFQGIDSETEASRFVNKEIYSERDKVRSFETDGEDDADGIYAEDLVGYGIQDTGGKYIGRISSVDVSTENVLLDVSSGEKQFLLPLADELIADIDEERRLITMSIPEGLTDL